MSHDSDLDSWAYWRDKKGYEGALLVQYPALAKTDPIIVASLMQIKMAKMTIDKRMEELQDD